MLHRRNIDDNGSGSEEYVLRTVANIFHSFRLIETRYNIFQPNEWCTRCENQIKILIRDSCTFYKYPKNRKKYTRESYKIANYIRFTNSTPVTTNIKAKIWKNCKHFTKQLIENVRKQSQSFYETSNLKKKSRQCIEIMVYKCYSRIASALLQHRCTLRTN